MAEPQMVDPHDVVMTGENSFIRLSNDGGKTIDRPREPLARAVVAGGTGARAVHRVSRLAGKGPRVYADNLGVARYLQRTIETLLCTALRRRVAADHRRRVPAQRRFAQHGGGAHRVAARTRSCCSWWDLMKPFILTMPPGAMNRPLGVYSTFIPASSAQLSVNGQASRAAGVPAGALRQARPRAAASPGRRAGPSREADDGGPAHREDGQPGAGAEGGAGRRSDGARDPRARRRHAGDARGHRRERPRRAAGVRVEARGGLPHHRRAHPARLGTRAAAVDRDGQSGDHAEDRGDNARCGSAACRSRACTARFRASCI